MRFGFAKRDITPRLGVEMSGFGPFLNRRALAVRDRLWARAMAVSCGARTQVLISCDIIGMRADTVALVRQRLQDAAGLSADQVMVHCIHTHSGPATDIYCGWGQRDEPYMEILPGRIAGAALDALQNMTEATLSHAHVPCVGMGLNREYDRDAPPLEEVLRDDWRPAKPELTDTACHVFTVHAGEKMLGFLSYFGCHPVVCCQETHYLHGDYAGVATNMLERENPGSVGLFLLGAHGDVNSCVVHKPEKEALLALDVIAARYANQVRAGMRQAAPLALDALASARRERDFSRVWPTVDEMRRLLAEKEAILHAPDASDADHEVRMAAVFAVSLRKMIREMEAGTLTQDTGELLGFRLGPVAFLGAPFEIFQAIKNDVVAAAHAPIPLVMSQTNGSLGYAPDRTMTARGGYAAQMVPVIKGALPFKDIHGELAESLLALDADLFAS